MEISSAVSKIFSSFQNKISSSVQFYFEPWNYPILLLRVFERKGLSLTKRTKRLAETDLEREERRIKRNCRDRARVLQKLQLKKKNRLEEKLHWPMNL